jgi:hypothetical protein
MVILGAGDEVVVDCTGSDYGDDGGCASIIRGDVGGVVTDW